MAKAKSETQSTKPASIWDELDTGRPKGPPSRAGPKRNTITPVRTDREEKQQRLSQASYI